MVVAWRLCGRRDRARGGIRDRRDAAQCGPTRLPPVGRAGQAPRAARARRGRGDRHRDRAEAAARSCLHRRRRPAAQALGFPRPHRAAEPVGHLVRAVPQGDAGARRAAGEARRRASSRWSPSTSTRAISTSRRPGSTRSASSGSATSPIRAPRCFRISRAIGKAIGMPTTLLIDPEGCELGDARRSRRMGERGCHQADRGREGAVGRVLINAQQCPLLGGTEQT